MIDVFTPKKISSYFPFKGNQRLTKISILAPTCLTLRCDAHNGSWLRGMMHTAQLDSTVWCTLQSFLRNRVTWLRSVMHTGDLDSEVWCTPRSLTPQWDAHRGVWLPSGMHSAEFIQILSWHDSKGWCTLLELFKKCNISAKSKPNSKIF